MSVRKYTHKTIKNITMTREQIMFVEDEWYSKFNKAFYNTNTNKVG
jgi:hypothetical protein